QILSLFLFLVLIEKLINKKEGWVLMLYLCFGLPQSVNGLALLPLPPASKTLFKLTYLLFIEEESSSKYIL
ncbi:MAG TPA: hypothetical protein VFD60_12440, partial [Nitrososphaeraceae archaeon]|nr:hypothetical protein [Nitrososphaeraceae archaeon]